jgi:hypothetical protein
MNFMSVFFEKKYNQGNSSVVNNMQYNLFTIFPLSGPFAELGFLFLLISSCISDFKCHSYKIPLYYINRLPRDPIS